MNDAGRAIIAGAGIAGLTATLALVRAGIAVTILEKRTVLDEGGAGIQLSPNASGVLFGLGLGPALMRHAVEPAKLNVRDLARGRLLAQADLGPRMRERYGAPYLVIGRADLHRILLDAVRSRTDARLLVGRTVVEAASDDDGVRIAVDTAGGQRDELSADLLVGADGLWSELRAAIVPGAAPRFRGYHAWRATIEAHEMPGTLSLNETGLWLGRGCHLVHYPIAGRRLVNIVAVQRARQPLAGWSAGGNGRDLSQAIRGAAPPIRELIARAHDWRIWSLYDLPRLRRWHAGRTVLVGDAAHPVLPFLAQGGALAIEDAGVLAECLTPDVLADRAWLQASLAAFETARRERAHAVQSAARRNGRVYHMSGPMGGARNLVMRQLGNALVDRYDWLYRWHLPTPDETSDPDVAPA